VDSARGGELAASATVERVAKRLHWTPPDDIVKLVREAADRSQQQTQLWIEYRTDGRPGVFNRPVQPIYRVGAQIDRELSAHRRRLDTDLPAVKPASRHVPAP
jgi:peptide/nickel transport system substrate-binding protein